MILLQTLKITMVLIQKKTQEETAVLESGETWASVARSGSGGRTIEWQIAGIHLFVPSNKLRPIMTIQTRYIWF